MNPDFTKTRLERCQGFEAPCKNVKAEWVMTGSNYTDEKSNWAYLCQICEKLAHDYWSEMMDEYYRSQL